MNRPPPEQPQVEIQSLIGAEPDPATSAQWEREQRQQEWDRDKYWTLIRDGLLADFCKGELTLERLCELAVEGLQNYTQSDRLMLLGYVIEQAIDRKKHGTIPPRGRGRRGSPRFIRGVSAELVKTVAQREGAPISRVSAAGSKTAFERVAEIWLEYNIQVTPAQVERWYGEFTTQIKD